MRDTIDMAREAGFEQVDQDVDEWICFTGEIERLVALVRADQDERYKWDIHSCGPTCKRYACVAMREAVEAEREACAKVCEETEVVQTTYCMTLHDEGAKTLRNAAAAIRARGNT